MSNYVGLSSLFFGVCACCVFLVWCAVGYWSLQRFLGDCKLKKLKLSEELIEIKDKILKFRLAY